ncbi:MAG: peptide ABC transporter permease, partial [Acidimicrobiia bacterium]|nr:peptide ABC transporter permease [Acidimicrobiia bacterium]
MLKFIIRRVSQMVVVLVVLSVLLFAWLHSLPGGPAGALLGVRGDAESLAALEEALGLDQPIWVQYARFVERAISGDFGTSNGVLRGADAMDVFLTRLPATIELSMLALIIAVSLAIPIGYMAARRRGSLLDTGSIIGSLVGVAVPIFFLAFVLKYIFAIRLGILPPSGRQSTGL